VTFQKLLGDDSRDKLWYERDYFKEKLRESKLFLAFLASGPARIAFLNLAEGTQRCIIT
jgi:hypothetical protein